MPPPSSLLNRDVITHINQVKDKFKNFSVHETHTTLNGKYVNIIAISDIYNEALQSGD